jgi:hypothetical protein
VGKKDKRIFFFRSVMVLLYLLSFAVIIYFLVLGKDFYTMALMERPHHPDYRNLRPAGLTGHGLGVIGSLMMIFMLLYSVRKRTRIFKNFGFLSNWLRLHIYFGIIGPLLIVLHSSFKVHGVIAISFWSMIAVAMSGVLGRYLYIQIPRTISGKELSLDELKNIDEEMTREINSRYLLNDGDMARLKQLVSRPPGKNKDIVRILLEIIFSDFLRPVRYLQLRRQISRQFKFGRQVIHKIARSLLRKEVLERRINQWSAVQELFHYWHVIHKPFAIIMYIIMIVHIMIAIYVGYAWIF